MDTEEFRSILSRSRADIWSLIDTAIRVAGTDDSDELRRRRDKIVAALYAPESRVCNNCSGGGGGALDDAVQEEHPPYYPEYIGNGDDNVIGSSNEEEKKFNGGSDRDFVSKNPLTPESNHQDLSGGEEEEDPFGGLFEDDQTTILNIKEQLEDPNQSEDVTVELLQSLADMDITYQVLQDTDIGRNVNRLRKHQSDDVRLLAKQLIRKWKETVDKAVNVDDQNTSTNIIVDEDSPQQYRPRATEQTGHHQVPDFGFSPNPRNGSSSVERNYSEHQTKSKAPQATPRTQPPSRPPKAIPKSAPASLSRAASEPAMDDERLNSARRRLQENYQEAQNAKKQRKIQVMDIHEIPKPKNGFFAKNKGNFQGRHHR